jgi:hypothetical protein
VEGLDFLAGAVVGGFGPEIPVGCREHRGRDFRVDDLDVILVQDAYLFRPDDHVVHGREPPAGGGLVEVQLAVRRPPRPLVQEIDDGKRVSLSAVAHDDDVLGEAGPVVRVEVDLGTAEGTARGVAEEHVPLGVNLEGVHVEDDVAGGDGEAGLLHAVDDRPRELDFGAVAVDDQTFALPVLEAVLRAVLDFLDHAGEEGSSGAGQPRRFGGSSGRDGVFPRRRRAMQAAIAIAVDWCHRPRARIEVLLTVRQV